MKLAPFDQTKWAGSFATIARQQEAAVSPDRGVCTGLCLIWLRLMQAPEKRTPTERMRELAGSIPEAVRLQAQYEATALAEAERRKKDDAMTAGLAAAAGSLDLGVFEKTVVERSCVGKAGMVRTLERDLAERDARVLWGLVGPDGGHAIAGVNNSGRTQTTTDRNTLHVFDPNHGEYVLQPQELPAMVEEWHRLSPMYARFTVMKRRSVSFLDEMTSPGTPSPFFSELPKP
ncbi:MAG: YopT-type cysteine protease domain-containing protein [Elioraea tepidiphila]